MATSKNIYKTTIIVWSTGSLKDCTLKEVAHSEDNGDEICTTTFESKLVRDAKKDKDYHRNKMTF